MRSFDDLSVADLRAAGGLKWTRWTDALGAWVAEMDFGTAPAVTDALRLAVDGARHGYMPDGVASELADACAAWNEAAYGWSVEPHRIRPLPDVVRALEVAIDDFTEPGTPIVVPTPAYMPFFTVPVDHGRDVIEVPAIRRPDGRLGMDLDGIARAFEQGAQLVILCNPHNPIGRVYERDELLAFADMIDAVDGRVFADEIHGPLVYEPHEHIPYASVSTDAARHAITATSASKGWNLPGLKCAQVLLTNDDDLERWQGRPRSAEHGTSIHGAIANIAAYRHGRPWLDDVLAYLDGNRHHFVSLVDEHLPDVVHAPPEGTYLAWLDCRALGLDDLGHRYRTAGVALTDGAACGAPGHVRVNIATPRHVLDQIVERMATVR